MMNIKRIIREELETVLDSFYLLVSEDEIFIYKRGHLGGYRWESIKSLTPKEIINSGFKEYSEPEEMISRMKRGSTNLTPKNQDTKIVPKIVPVDFIIKKREETFPILESNDNDFNWVKEITPFTPGKLFDEDDICFNSKDCNININKDNITFKIDWEEWCEAVGVEGDDDWILKDVLFYGPGYDGNGDFYEFDSDEFNYSGYHMNEVQKTRFNEMLHRIDPNLDFYDYSEDAMLSLNQVLKYPKLKSLFDKLIDSYLNTIGYVVQKNRWLSIGSTIRETIIPTGIDFDLYSNSYGGYELHIIVPIDKVFEIYNKKNITDLSELVISISEFLVEKDWSEWFYEDWDTSGSDDEMEEFFNDFLDKSEDFLEDENLIGEYKKLMRMLDELGFINLGNRFLVTEKYYKENNNGTKWLLTIDENMNCILKLFDSSVSSFDNWNIPEHIERWVFKNPINVNEIKNKILSVSK